MRWLGGVPIYVGKNQVAEVLRDKVLGYTIRNLRENGNIGVCFTSPEDGGAIREWLNKNYPGWTKCAKS
jgi:hypothetical protein